ncbi:MAG: hypothetical protein E6Q97_06550 [Desulfurellales bacterium]|nr:MAG: hypothetical protein E6Q97_06550 [Desulfurellales bacterium]
MKEKRLLMRKIIVASPDGTAVTRNETIEVEIIWPFVPNEDDITYEYRGQFVLVSKPKEKP